MDAAVIIVGGGPVGLSLSLGLARYGVRSMLLERNAEPVAESRAVVIWPRTQEIFRDWGVYDAVRSRSRFIDELIVVNARNEKVLVALDWNVIDDVVEKPGALIIPQNETESALRELVRANQLCELRTGVTVTGLRQDHEAVDVTYADGANKHVVRGSYVAGCDGAHGVVRHLVGLALQGTTYDTRIVLSDELFDEDFDRGVTARARLDHVHVRGALKFGERMWRVVAAVPADDGNDEDILSQCAHQERLRDIFGDRASTTMWSSVFNIHKRHAQQFVVGRVALAGDAAHLNSPAGGQGMNAGIQDAANLAWKIAYALRGQGDGRTLFGSFDVERREMVTDTIERYTDRLTRVALGVSTRAKQFVVRAVSRAIRGRGMQRKTCRALGMLSGRYTKSPIIDISHPLAGRRIDDLRLEHGRRISEMRNGDPLLVVVGDYELAVPHVTIRTPPKRWHVKPPVVLIVRPDGCVASVVTKPTRERIESAWNKAFCGTLRL